MKFIPKLLLVGGGELPEIRSAVARRGCRALVINHAESIERLERDDLIEFAEAVDFTQPLAVVRRIQELHRIWDFETVVPVCEFGLQPATVAAHRLGLPSVSLRAVQNTRDKVRMRRVLEKAGLGQVRYAPCRSPAEAEAFLREIGGPVIVKPIIGTGSDGVSRVDSVDQLVASFELASTARAFGGVLCEEYIAGPEVSVEGFSVAGRFTPVAMTDKLTNKSFLEVGHNQPSAQPASIQAAAFEFTGRVLQALDVKHGVSHTELKITPHGPVLIETHTRMGGDWIHLLTLRTTGVDLADITVGMALGERPEVKPQPPKIAAAIRFLPSRCGRIGSIEIPSVEPRGGVESAKVYLRPGDFASGRSSSIDRLGHVIAVGSSVGAASTAAEQFLSRIQISIEQEQEPWITPAA